MEPKKIIPIIAMISVLLMLILMYAGVKQSWLAVFVGGIAITAVSILGKKKPEQDKDPQDKDPQENKES